MIHICCTTACGEPTILIGLLRTNIFYRKLFPVDNPIENYAENESVDLDVNAVTQDREGTTALHLASKLSGVTNDIALVHILLKANANVNIRDSGATTVLDIALEDKNRTLTALLLSQSDMIEYPSVNNIPKTLNLSYLELNTYPEGIHVLASKLEYLDLSNNAITFIPPSFSQLVNLTKLNLSNLNLSIIPNSLLGLHKLQYVDLSNNRITIIPPQIENLQLLHTLKLRENLINALPSALCRLPKLQKLAIDKNPLESIPKEVIGRDIKSLMGFLAQLDGQTTNWKRIKLLVLGEEAVGKTRCLF